MRIWGSLRSMSIAFCSSISLFAGCGWLFFAIKSWQEEASIFLDDLVGQLVHYRKLLSAGDAT